MSNISGTQFACDHCGEEEFLSEGDLENQDKPTGWIETEPSTDHPSGYGNMTHYCSQSCKDEHEEQNRGVEDEEEG